MNTLWYLVTVAGRRPYGETELANLPVPGVRANTFLLKYTFPGAVTKVVHLSRMCYPESAAHFLSLLLQRLDLDQCRLWDDCSTLIFVNLSDFRPVCRPNPALLFVPFAVLPQAPLSAALANLLNFLLAYEREAGELDFLKGRVFEVILRDTPVRLAIGMRGGRLVSAHGRQADASVSARLSGFIALLSQREDPDTLFFRRELMMGGDTDLGLQVKNVLDQVDPSRLPSVLTRLLVLCDPIVYWLESGARRPGAG
ncbi:MAG: SCP2 sterol-binding domain-containing protein [Arenicellales bacterium]|nr:SCP2 sterol-binding domain-containing protein [Arenicellales bacterium]MDP6551143.1 SCP2 sterol-binding domain-containing protein [Arenicellales bacterium]MDP6918943.1 SCP2 sterol-binding domain-containing protein [Arenicellales bacterium]